MATWIISILLAALLAWIIYGLVKKKRSGAGCHQGCSSCPNHCGCSEDQFSATKH